MAVDLDELELFNLTASDIETAVSSQIMNFKSILDSLTSIDDKQKLLWNEIFSNAVRDRALSLIAYTDLYRAVHTIQEMHNIHGQNLTRYLERMEKLNTQLIKLAEQVSSIKESEESFQGNVYEHMEKNHD